MSFLSFGFTFNNLHETPALEKLDGLFLSFLEECSSDLTTRLKNARQSLPASQEESALLLDLAPYVEDYISTLFSIEKEVHSLQESTFHLTPLYRCKRLFVQRQAAKIFTKEEAQRFNGPHLQQKIEGFLGESYGDLAFSRHVLKALEQKETHQSFLQIALQYAAWSLYQNNPSLLFRLPRKINPDFLIPLKKEGKALISAHQTQRKGFDCTDPGVTIEEALDQANYCILCHNQAKDSCAKGHSEKAKGCPLGQKISEMNTLRTQGFVVGALAMIMVDNPMVAATGRRICNDCEKACIFQKQEAVDIPSIESQTLDSVLHLPWGVEIYSLLSRWNPLNLRRPFPKEASGYKVLVAGMGPAGFTLAHYLMNEGHTVVGLEALKIEPLEKDLLTQPIHDWSSLKMPLSRRTIEAFGGVMEYGITARWDKNYLKIVRLLLERRSLFSLNDGITLGTTFTLKHAFDLGFDHIALCLGAGLPNSLSIPHENIGGVRFAADFLRDLQLKEPTQTLTDYPIRLPILVVGGGLTAVDAATEALASYAFQVENLLEEEKKSSSPAHSKSSFSTSPTRGDVSLKNASTIVYRKTLQESPSYRLNHKELQLAMAEGVAFLENTTPIKIHTDHGGNIESLEAQTPHGIEFLPCRTLLIATGTHPHELPGQNKKDLKMENDVLLSYGDENKVSFFGDLHSVYEGNVVKAMASAKKGYPYICEVLLKKSPSEMADFCEKLKAFRGD